LSRLVSEQLYAPEIINNLNHWFLNKNLPRLFGFAKYVGWLRMDLDREALDGIFGFFQVAYKSMVYFANFLHISFLSELTLCTTILVHHIFPYVVVPQESPVRDGWDLF
jgi:hypothetical protein